MKRRTFITVVGATAAFSLSARAQDRERVRRIGILMPGTANDLEYQTRLGAFLQALALLGWAIGRNVRIDTRWGAGNADDIRKYAAELVALAPDVILAAGTSTVGPVLQATRDAALASEASSQRGNFRVRAPGTRLETGSSARAVPIVFPYVVDPVGAGFVDSLARPGGNATGFLSFEYSLSGKWLEVIKQIAPSVTRVAVLRNPAVSSGPAQFSVIQAVAPSLRVEVSPLNMRDAGEIERGVAAFARSSTSGGLIVTGSSAASLHRDLIITLAARHKFPAVYNERSFVAAGGLVSYGTDFVEQYRHAAGYVDRILKGEKPADLPVQAPTKYEMVVNLKTAKALGLDIPAAVLARADEVIE